jgi:hypothetical protein
MKTPCIGQTFQIFQDYLTMNEITSNACQDRRFRCPLTKEIMNDPVVIRSTGKSYERQALVRWIETNGNRCPVTGEDISHIDTNFSLQWEILYWLRKQQQHPSNSADDVATISSRKKDDTHEELDSISRSIDSPPSRPRRKDSFCGTVDVMNSEPPQPPHLSCRFVPTYDTLIPFGLNLLPPRRIQSGLSIDQLNSGAMDDGDELSISRLVSILDEALMIATDLND